MQLVAKITGCTYEHNEFKFNEWQSKVKQGTFKYNELPQVDMGNNNVYTQRLAILKCAASKGNLYPTTNADEALKVDEILELYADTLEYLSFFHPSLKHLVFTTGKEADATTRQTQTSLAGDTKQHITDCVNNRLQIIDSIYSKRGNNGFANGKSLTVADIVTFCVCRLVESGICEGISSDCVNQCKNVVQCKKNVEDKIKSTGVKLSSPRISVTREAVIAG